MARAWTTAARTIWRVDLERLFDRQFYLAKYPDVARSHLDPLVHFLLYGAAEGRQPHPLFDTAGYLAENPDVAAAGRNPLVHFLRDGWKEQRRPNALFDAQWYREHHPDVPPDHNPFLHYLQRRKAGESVAAGPQASEYLPVNGAARVRPAPLPAGIVDIVIPVYRGLEETQVCLESVLRSLPRSATAAQIVLVNDCSPQRALADYLRRRAEECGATVLENASNLGFVQSANRAMDLHPDRDIVLLNSDTEVAGDWLDRLAAAAWARPRTGTATPFSNHATICSYPCFGVRNFLPAGTSVAELDSVFRLVNHGRRVAVPTAVGFCMYIRRDCLRETGVFNAQAFGKGYGEENDFSLRAAQNGWQHVLAADVFVYHAGGVSLSEESEKRRAAALETMRRMHPQYDAAVGQHVRRDPARPYRFAASAWRLRHGSRPVILAVSHSLGGGVAQHLEELHAALAGEAEMLVLSSLPGGLVMLRNLDPADDFRLVLEASDYSGLLAILESCGITRVHVHHLIGHTIDVRGLCRDLRVPFDFTAHDYFSICPQVRLADQAGRYCGEPGEEGCNRCLAVRPPEPGMDIAAWRRKHSWLIREAERVITPSADTAVRLRQYFPGSLITAATHPEAAITGKVAAAQLSPAAPLRIAAAGVMTWEKGLHNLRACAEQARERSLPLEFLLAGYVEKTLPVAQPFPQTGAYAGRRVADFLAGSGAHLVWFPAVAPETYSYTLSACLEAMLPVVVPNLGALPERVQGRPWSWIVDWNWTPEQFLDFFLGIREQNFVRGAAPENTAMRACAARAQADFYPRDYLVPLQPASTRVAVNQQ